MESNIADQRFFGNESQLAEPHFDEEATLLSARPVVPLEMVAAEGRLNRPWVLGLALAGALLLGVAATAIYYSRVNRQEVRAQANVETSASDVQNPQSSESAGGLNESPVIAGGATVNSDRVDSSAKVMPDAIPGPPVSSTTSSNTAAGVAKRASRTPATLAERSNRESENREERLASRREANQQDRQLQRERRASKTSDDLLRIREIFEGPPRP